MAKAMTGPEIVKALMDGQGMTQSEMSRRLRITPQALFARLNKKVSRTDSLCEMAAILGYKVVVVPNGKRVEAGEYEVK